MSNFIIGLRKKVFSVITAICACFSCSTVVYSMNFRVGQIISHAAFSSFSNKNAENSFKSCIKKSLNKLKTEDLVYILYEYNDNGFDTRNLYLCPIVPDSTTPISFKSEEYNKFYTLLSPRLDDEEESNPDPIVSYVSTSSPKTGDYVYYLDDEHALQRSQLFSGHQLGDSFCIHLVLKGKEEVVKFVEFVSKK